MREVRKNAETGVCKLRYFWSRSADAASVSDDRMPAATATDANIGEMSSFEELVEAESADRLNNRLAFSLAYSLLHTARVMSYAPLLAASLLRWPFRTASAITAYYTLRFRSSTWRRAVVRLASLSSSKRPRLLRAQTKPYDRTRRYVLAAHPHGILNYGWWNLIARFGVKPLLDGLELVMCMAPAVQWYPIYGEIFEDRAADASATTVRRVLAAGMTPALIPGGFSEAVYTAASPDEEYAYLAERSGFVKLAIEHGVDIIPSYTYGLNDMYHTVDTARHWRAVKAQASGLPLVLWWGPWLFNNVPATEDVTVATFDPFPASKYTLDELPEAHAAYLAYLKQCFDSRKAECGAAHKELRFIGKHTTPAQAAAAAAAATPRSRL